MIPKPLKNITAAVREAVALLFDTGKGPTFSFLIILTPILGAAKLAGYFGYSWWIVAAPLLIWLAGTIAFILCFVLMLHIIRKLF